jgi:hypothetical protein
MEISVNRIIIAETNDQRRGERGGGRIESHSSQLFDFKPQIMTQPPVCMYLRLKVLKFEKILTRI